jgi:glutamine synthetase
LKLENPRLTPQDASWPPQAPEVSPLTQGYQYLTETRFDQIDAALMPIRRGVAALGMPLRSLEVELGPSQCEFTFRPQSGLAAADTMILFRAATKQIARRNSCLASFMCRPGLPNLFSSGWHLHQSLIERRHGSNAFAGDKRHGLSAVGLHFLGGLLAHAEAATAFATPTVNGYKRYRPYAGAGSRDLGARQSRRDGARARPAGRSGDASGESRRRARGQSVPLHGFANLCGA